jgi:hypothetical protein
VITLVNPKEEIFISVMEDSSADGPEFVVSGGSLHLVFASEEEMVVNQLLGLFGSHCGMSEELTLEIAIQSGKYFLH